MEMELNEKQKKAVLTIFGSDEGQKILKEAEAKIKGVMDEIQSIQTKQSKMEADLKHLKSKLHPGPEVFFREVKAPGASDTIKNLMPFAKNGDAGKRHNSAANFFKKG
jgi:hypothetical protein